jgi:ABC-type branched-subunit amino acid transport system permease subunit
MTLAFALTTTSLLLNPLYLGKHLPATLNRPSLLGMRLDDQRVFYYFTLVLLAGIIAAVVGMKRSRTARALIACRDNEQAGQSFGINLLRVRLMAFAVSGFLSAFAGALFAFHQHGVRIAAYAPEVSIFLFLFTVIGGLGSVSGPLIGMFFLGVMTVVNLGGMLQLFATGGGVLLILLFVPGGLSQIVFGLRDSILRRVARRYRIVVPSLVADVRQQGRMRLPIAPKQRPGGGTSFVASRYRLPDQWALAHHGAPERSDG